MLLHAALKQHFGFDSFKPRQEEAVRAALAGRDVFALLPTGGGKSLCFQLPAVMEEGLTIVVSPLIALMKDQVDALQLAGIAGHVPQFHARCRRGQIAPPLALRRRAQAPLHRPGAAHAPRLPRPRRLRGMSAASSSTRPIASPSGATISARSTASSARLRERFPGIPIMALTATATGRVREDIVKHLHLADPAIVVGSFNRQNLTYRVIPKEKPYRQVLAFLQSRPGESGIIYCSSRKSDRAARRKAYRRQNPRASLPRRAHRRAALGKPGALPARRGPGHLRHHRLRHGHQ